MIKRLPGEPFDAYKRRRKMEQERLKQYLKGKLVWNVSNKRRKEGKTYVKSNQTT